MSPADQLRAFAAQFDTRFRALLEPQEGVPPRLAQAVHYSALAPGKRVRPFLTVRCCELAGGELDAAWPAAAAVECIHAFSLIHDDLPAMDDDDVRRGQPTCHRKFGEAVAILAGDALVVLAFDLVTRHVEDKAVAAKIVSELAGGTGWAGMIGGQVADVLGENEPSRLELVDSIHVRKTARLFAAACRIGALVARGGDELTSRLGQYGQSLGRAFQIADDLLDVAQTADNAGDVFQKHAGLSKQSYPACVGIEASRRAAAEAADRAIAGLSTWGSEADDLRRLARFVVDRSY